MYTDYRKLETEQLRHKLLRQARLYRLEKEKSVTRGPCDQLSYSALRTFYDKTFLYYILKMA